MSELRQLHELAQIRLGLAFKKAVKDVGEHGEYYLIQPRDIDSSGDIDFESLPRVLPETEAFSHVLKRGDVVVRLRGPIFSASIIGVDLELPIITTNQSAVIRCDEERLNSDYLQWYINSPFGQRYLTENSEGTNISKVSAKIISNMSLMAPSLKEQRKIGSIQRNWLAQKAIYRKLIENGNEFYGELCNRIHTGKAKG